MRAVAFLILACLALYALAMSVIVAAYWPPRLGLDLAGGVSLVYEMDRETLVRANSSEINPDDVDWDVLLRALQWRMDANDIPGDVCRRQPWEIEVVVPNLNEHELARTKQLISTAGVLEFRIVANSMDHRHIIEPALAQAEDPERRMDRLIRNDDQIVGYWARVGRESTPTFDGLRQLKVHVATDFIRDANSGRIVELPAGQDWNGEHMLEQFLADQGIEEIDVLMSTDDGFDVTGAYLRYVTRGLDGSGEPCLNFSLTDQGAPLFSGLTSTNLPDPQTGFSRCLGIVLDDTLLSAPRIMGTISDRGQITGRFSQEEIDFLAGILAAGSLPVPLKSVPVSETAIAADSEAIESTRSTVLTAGGLLLAVWLGMLIRYRWIGLSGAINSVLLILLVMGVVVGAPLTLNSAAITTIAVVSLSITVANAGICESSRTSKWRYLIWATVLVACSLIAMAVYGLCAYAGVTLSDLKVADVIVVGGLAGLLTSCVFLPVLIFLLKASRAESTSK